LAFLKLFARNKIVWPYGHFLAFLYFKDCFGEIWAKLAIFYEILTLDLAIWTHFWGQFGHYLAFIWPLFIFEDLTFFETAYAQIWPFNFFDLATLPLMLFLLAGLRLLLALACGYTHTHTHTHTHNSLSLSCVCVSVYTYLLASSCACACMCVCVCVCMCVCVCFVLPYSHRWIAR